MVIACVVIVAVVIAATVVTDASIAVVVTDAATGVDFVVVPAIAFGLGKISALTKSSSQSHSSLKNFNQCPVQQMSLTIECTSYWTRDLTDVNN